MSAETPLRSGRPLFRPQKKRSGRGLRRFLTLSLLVVLLAVAVGAGWLLYITNNGSQATAAVGKEANTSVPTEPSATVTERPVPPSTKPPIEQASLETKPPKAAPLPDSAPPVAAAPANLPRPVGQGEGPALTFCYQGKVPDSRLLVVDKSRQRLMVLRYMGQMLIEFEYPCATGMQTGSKQNAGDERTPEGIYFTTHRFEDNKITVFGDRAIHLDYPNAFDQCANRDGSGIFLHGTDKNLKPRSSNGCVVMRNDDLAIVSTLIKEQFTPIIVVDHLVLPKAEERGQTCDFLQRLALHSLEQAEAKLGPQVSLLTPPPQKSVMNELDILGQRLAGFDLKSGKIEAQTLGMAIFGLGNSWVVVADQRFKGPKNEELSVTRRFYLNGEDLAKASLVQGQWVVADTPQAKLLASWAPPLPPAPAPVLVASAKPAAPAEQRPAPAAAIKEPAPAPAAHQPQPPTKSTPEEHLRTMLAQWLKAWGSKNVNAYISFYATDFRSQGMDREAWRKHKTYLNNVYREIGVEAKNVKVEMVGTKARVTFTQHYRSDWHRDVGRKTLELVLRGGHWQIIRENWEALPGRA